ncbi:lipoprotein [Polaromonas sp.]|uniref:lipoprotein n=1 Tax=Polaromonas sp. TaxID=1869339 RepID=UPI002FC77A4B
MFALLQILGRLRAFVAGHGLAAVVVSLGALAILPGCGQKGPLFLPVPKPAPTAQTGTAAPAAIAPAPPTSAAR